MTRVSFTTVLYLYAGSAIGSFRIISSRSLKRETVPAQLHCDMRYRRNKQHERRRVTVCCDPNPYGSVQTVLLRVGQLSSCNFGHTHRSEPAN